MFSCVYCLIVTLLAEVMGLQMGLAQEDEIAFLALVRTR